VNEICIYGVQYARKHRATFYRNGKMTGGLDGTRRWVVCVCVGEGGNFDDKFFECIKKKYLIVG